jgi:hypothetical protein
VNVEISPAATDEEVAAMVAAVEALWPKPVFIESSPISRLPTWRFSNRWWVQPLASRRDRPYR